MSVEEPENNSMHLHDAILSLDPPATIAESYRLYPGMPTEFSPFRDDGLEELLRDARIALAYSSPYGRGDTPIMSKGYSGCAAYWGAIVALLEAATITGAARLPDVPAVDPHYGRGRGALDFGLAVLRRAQDLAAEALDVEECRRTGTPSRTRKADRVFWLFRARANATLRTAEVARDELVKVLRRAEDPQTIARGEERLKALQGFIDAFPAEFVVRG